MKRFVLAAFAALALASCGDVSYVQKESPANQFKDYRGDTGSAVVGIGEPISKRQMRANATIKIEGAYALSDVMEKVANTYNIAVRYGAGVRQEKTADIVINQLSFSEARSYIEDVFKVQIVREGERRLLVLPAVDTARIKEFSPGTNVSLAEAVRGLAKQCDMNMVITENRDKLMNTLITTTLKNISCTDAFEALLSPHGLSLLDEGNYFTIGGLPSRSWTVNLYEPLRSETQRVNYSASVEESGSSSGTSSSNGTSSGANGNASGSSAEVLIREDRDFWSELQNDLQTLLTRSCEEQQSSGNSTSSSGLLPPPTNGTGGGTQTLSSGGTSSGQPDCGYVRVNRTVGTVKMQASRSVLDEADHIVKRVEDVASRRLLVEARVLAVNRTRGYEQGADIAASGKQNGTLVNLGFDPATNPLRSDISITGALASLATSGGGGFAAFQAKSLDAVVRLVESFGTTYQLMQPTIEVMDRQKAVLIDGRNERYFVRQSEVIASDGGNIVNTVANERVQFVGLQFAVTAQIASGDEPHTLAIQIPITEIVRFADLQQTFGSNTVTDKIPIANTRVIDQKVRIRDGEIKVIGGLTRTMAIDKESGIPLLRGVPALHGALNEESISFENVEFVVLLQVRRLK